MGLESRDYARTDDSYSLRGGGLSVVGWIIVVNVVVFALQCVWTRPAGLVDFGAAPNIPQEMTERLNRSLAEHGERVSVLQDWLALDRGPILGGQIWRLVTYDLLHDTSHQQVPWHLIFNMYLLYLIGDRLVDRHSVREFLLLYVVSALASGVFYLAWGYMVRTNHPAIGASGAVSALLVVFAMRYPNTTWTVFYVMPVTAKWAAIIYAGIDLYPMLKQLGGTRDISGVAHSAHIGGMLFGYLYQRYDWSLESMFDGRKLARLFRSRPKLRVIRDDPRDNSVDEIKLRARMDQLLEKITEHGMTSLTAHEQAELKQASHYFQQQRTERS